MRSKPEREDEIPSAGINWKLFLLVAVIIGIALAAFTLLPSGEENGTPATDIDGTGADVVGQGSRSNSPAAAVETETPDAKNVRPNNPPTVSGTLLPPEIEVVDISGTSVKIKITNNYNYYYQCVGVGVYLKGFDPNRHGIPVPKDFFL